MVIKEPSSKCKSLVYDLIVKKGVEDMVLLSKVTEDQITENLKKRYRIWYPKLKDIELMPI